MGETKLKLLGRDKPPQAEEYSVVKSKLAVMRPIQSCHDDIPIAE